MLQDKRRTSNLQQQLLSKRLGPADATQPRPPPSPELATTVVRCVLHLLQEAAVS